MDGKQKVEVDWNAAAERMIVALADRAGRKPESPLASRYLVLITFGPQICRHWSHESRRRRVRELAHVAKDILKERGQYVPDYLTPGTPVPPAAVQIVANTEGYWITGSLATMAAYAARRRRQGLVALKAASAAKTAMAPAQGQQTLFPCGPAGPHRHRFD